MEIFQKVYTQLEKLLTINIDSGAWHRTITALQNKMLLLK